MTYSVTLTDTLNAELLAHLIRPDGQEDLCFAVWYPSRGRSRTTAVLHGAVLPRDGERRVHGNAELLPVYFERVLQAALEAGGGLALLHSHPGSGWQDMSAPDVRAEKGLAPAVMGATGLPLIGLTLAARNETWSARFWERTGPRRYRRFWCASVRVVGDRLRVSYHPRLLTAPTPQPSQVRTVSAWGEAAQGDLTRLRVGIVGAGSVGSIIAEALARTGFHNILLLDFDAVHVGNLDRTLHARRHDADASRPKVTVVARGIRGSATASGFRVEPLQLSVCEEDGYRLALDCDVLFSCVDRPWPRGVLNFIAYAHLIPVIDGGIFVSRTKNGALRGADWKAHIVTHGHRCLRCLGQYEPGLVAAERSGELDTPSYIESLPTDHPVRAKENVFAFSLAAASLEVLQLIMLAVGTSGLGPPGPQNYHLTTGEIDLGEHTCDTGCPFPGLVGRGEEAGHPGIGRHLVAERARSATIRNAGKHK